MIIGGLRRQEKTIETDQIPFFSELPLIGGLFKSTNDVVKNSELIVFLSPHIYKNGEIKDADMKKYKKAKELPSLSLPKKKDSGEDLLSLLAID